MFLCFALHINEIEAFLLLILLLFILCFHLELNVTLHVGILLLTWNPVAHAETYDVIFKIKIEDKGEIYREKLYEPKVEISLKDIKKYKEAFIEVGAYNCD